VATLTLAFPLCILLSVESESKYLRFCKYSIFFRLPLCRIEGLSGKRGEVPFEKLGDLMVDIK